MRIDYDIALEVAFHEAIVRQTYRDSKNIPTWSVGITSASGHDVSRYVNNPQPLEYCLRVYVEILEKYAARVRRAFSGVELTKAQFAAALSFEWNTGSIGRAAWVKSFKAGNIALARRQFMQWNKPKEIIGRREKERDLFFDGKWANNGTMTEYTRLTKRGTPDWGSARKIDVRVPLREALAGINSRPPHAPAPAPMPKPRPSPAPAKSAPKRIDVEFVPGRIDIEFVQRRLREIGYHEVGEVDGQFGARSRGALLAFKADNNMPLNPDIDADTMVALLHAGPRAVADSRAQATASDLEKKSVTVKTAADSKRVSLWAMVASAGSAAVSGVTSFFGDAVDQIAPIRGLIPDIPSWVWLAAVALVAYGLWRSSGGIVDRVVGDYRTGKKL